MKCDLVLLQETKLNLQSADRLFSSWKVWNFCSSPSSGASGGLVVIWRDFVVHFSLIASSSNWMLGLVKSRSSNLKFWLFNVYGPSGVLEKRILWNFLVSLATPLWNVFLIFGRDFNAITSMDEKAGGIIPNKHFISDFCNFIHSLNLVDCKPLNGSFTWTNMRRDFCHISKMLDHFMVSDNWFNSGQDFVSSILPFTSSDHFPIQFNIFEDRAPRKLPFKFEPMWFRDQSVLPSLKYWWNLAPFFLGLRCFN